MYNSCSKYR